MTDDRSGIVPLIQASRNWLKADPDQVAAWGTGSSAAAPVLLIGGWTLAASLQRNGFDSVTGTISALAAEGADRRWVMTGALAGVGLAHLTTAAALRPAGRGGRALLALGGLATLGVACSPLPRGDGGSLPHTLLATAAFLSLAVWPAFSVRRSAPLLAFRERIAWAVTAALVAEVGWFFAEVLSDGRQIGLSERLAAGSQALWPLAVVLISRTREGKPGDQNGSQKRW